jgi:hypothetical protein
MKSKYVMLAALVIASSVLTRAQAPPQQAIQAASAANVKGIAVTLPVIVLPTTFGLPGEEEPKYPSTVSVEAPPQLQLAAYGAAGHVWLAPRSWTGHGGVGVDGNIFVQLYPVGGNGVAGQRVTYTVMAACERCMFSSAAPYFPEALKQWNEEFNRDGRNPVAFPIEMVSSQIRPHLVHYNLPEENGLPVHGAAFYDPSGDGGDPFYEEVRMVLPETDKRLTEFLLKYFDDHTGPR